MCVCVCVCVCVWCLHACPVKSFSWITREISNNDCLKLMNPFTK